jgi:uncharacterized membrane protein
MLLGFLLEIGALALGFFGWGPDREARAERTPKGSSEPQGGKLDEVKPALPKPETVTAGDEPLSEDARLVLAAFHGRKGALRNVDLAERMGVVKSEASKRVAAAVAAGVVTSQKIGREVFITPASIN